MYISLQRAEQNLHKKRLQTGPLQEGGEGGEMCSERPMVLGPGIHANNYFNILY